MADPQSPDPLLSTAAFEPRPSLLAASVELEEAAASAPNVDESSALVRTPGRPDTSKVAVAAQPLPSHLQQIRFRLELRVSVPHFTLRNLQMLNEGIVLLTEHSSTRDLVLTAAGERLLLVELEAVESQLAARVKRLL